MNLITIVAKAYAEPAGAMVNGIAYGPKRAITLCQLHMRAFQNGDATVLEPFRAMAFKVIKDLIVDRTPSDQIIPAGGYVSVNTGGVPDDEDHLFILSMK